MWNSRSTRYSQGILIGLVVIGLGLSFGETTGVAINPVRDLCPRLAALSLGWSNNSVIKSFSRGDQWWTVGFFAPFIGAIIGSLLYIFVIGAQLRYDDGEENEGEIVTVMGQEVPGHDRWRANVFVPRVPGNGQPQSQGNGQGNGPPMIMNGRGHSPYAKVQFRQ